MKKLLKYTKAQRVSFAMCTYGAPTIKPTVFLGRMVDLACHGMFRDPSER